MDMLFLARYASYSNNSEFNSSLTFFFSICF